MAISFSGDLSYLGPKRLSVAGNLNQLGRQHCRFNDLSFHDRTDNQTGKQNNVQYPQKLRLKFWNLLQGTFYLYTGIAAVGVIVFYFILPETKGKTMEEMDQLFKRQSLST